MDPEMIALINYLLGQGYVGQQSFQTGGGVVPMSYDRNGMPEGGPSTDQARSLTFMNNYLGMMADPMMGAMAGPQAFGAEGFQPIREYVEGPQNARLQEYASKPLDTLEGWMADLVLREGALGVTAAAQQFLAADPELLDPAQQKIRQQLEQFSFVDPMSGEQRLDLSPLRSIASDLEQEKYLQADPNAQYDPETGRWFTEKPGPLTEKFAELGLPSPFDEYTVEGTMGPDFARQQDDLSGLQQDIYSRASAQNAERRQASAAEQAALARFVTPEFQDLGLAPAARQEQPMIGRPVPGDPGSQQMTQERWLEEYLAQGQPYGAEWRPGDFSAWPENDLAGMAAMNTADLNTIPPGTAPSPPSARRRGRADRSAAAHNMTASAGAKRRAESVETTGERRRQSQQSSAAMDAYRKFVQAQNDVYDMDYVRNHRAVVDARRQGRSPLSDVLSARRAQGVIGGLPIGWG